ncbi:hypothetical protein MES5069_1190028 [Mesorhizobium escarrei]|uniref:Uncharacterized protein n=1 Tax=Mesorhizobium escarrei TaxID=666018 RepID=A0ABN8JGB1_9HYPH|nr:hypothetical protein MES5069_1190028 [Mesorhizobium escarrei]
MEGIDGGASSKSLNRDGRYFARLVIPKDLRPFGSGALCAQFFLETGFHAYAAKASRFLCMASSFWRMSLDPSLWQRT